jgi:hypothetical protein
MPTISMFYGIIWRIFKLSFKTNKPASLLQMRPCLLVNYQSLKFASCKLGLKFTVNLSWQTGNWLFQVKNHSQLTPYAKEFYDDASNQTSDSTGRLHAVIGVYQW